MADIDANTTTREDANAEVNCPPAPAAPPPSNPQPSPLQPKANDGGKGYLLR